MIVGTWMNLSFSFQLWDVDVQKRLRSMASHTARVGGLNWNDHILSRYGCAVTQVNPRWMILKCSLKETLLLYFHFPSGSRSGHIHHHDVRVANHHIATLAGHSQEVCGLKWSPDGRYLASGGNDNLVCLWPRVQEGSSSGDGQLIRSWSEHQGAVKVNSFSSEYSKADVWAKS